MPPNYKAAKRAACPSRLITKKPYTKKPVNTAFGTRKILQKILVLTGFFVYGTRPAKYINIAKHFCSKAQCP